jgi:hypothetical protein
MNEQIMNGNILIAEFMNERKRNLELDEAATHYHYHKEWDWLMPVIQKIDTMGFDVKIGRISCSISRILEKEPIVSLVCGDISKKSELVFSTIVRFIEWFNKHNSTNNTEDKTYSLCEAVADISYEAGLKKYYSGDMRADPATFIQWAKEFEKRYERVEWGIDDYDYIDEMEKFMKEKLAINPEYLGRR